MERAELRAGGELDNKVQYLVVQFWGSAGSVRGNLTESRRSLNERPFLRAHLL